MKRQTTVLQVGGLSWATSAFVVEQTLRRRPGMLAVEANAVSQTANVTYDPGRTDVAQLSGWVRDCAYHCAGQSVAEHLCDPMTEPAATTAEGHEMHEGHEAAGRSAQDVMGHGGGHGGMSMQDMVADMRNRFLFAVVLSVPVLLWSPIGFTSRDPAIASPRLAALAELAWVPAGFGDLLPAHEQAWARLWGRFGVELDADRQTQLVLNLHVFHLLQSLSEHTASLDAAVPARGLHGEGYRGHVFWDELFVLPVLTAHLPWVSRSLLDYRWRRLDTARQAATKAGLVGAMFPWQSGSDGREETPPELYNRRSGRWMPDNSQRQRHVGLAVAFNAWQYYQATGDVAWLAHRGADLIIEVARLFAALATYDPPEDRFHIDTVMGPDEYHDGYPDAPGQGLCDNAYTNVLAAWVCARATDVLAVVAGHDCDDIHARLRIQAKEPGQWVHLSRRLAVPLHGDGIISQFDGYEALAELDWEHYRASYGNIGRLDHEPVGNGL